MSIVGQSIESLDTPVLWVDLDLMEKNIQQLSDFFKNAGVSWRPHTKGIKIPAIAHKMLDAGAIGVTCAKLSEAEVMAENGIKDILIANQIVGETKITRLCALRHHADVIVSITELENAQEISRMTSDAGVQVRVLMELNIGMNRAGVQPGQQAVDLGCQIANLPGIQFAGVMGWEGHVVGMEDLVAKRTECERAVRSLVETAALCRQAGLPVEIVSCGGSGSYQISSRIAGVTESQAGGAIFGDVTYRKWGAGTECSLFVRSTVTSRPTSDRAIIDAGQKTLNADVSIPEIQECPDIHLTALSAEHGFLKLDDPHQSLKTGDQVNLIVGYGDFTIFLHDQLIGVRQGRVETVWDILGRGKLT